MPRNALLVAPVGPDDVDCLTELWSAARAETGSLRIESAGAGKTMQRMVAEVLSRQGVHAFIARHDNKPVGYVILTSGPLLPLVDTPAVCIEHLFVQPDCRHKGAGTALISACATLAERVGAEQVAVGVPSSEREPNRFFARLGFSPFVVRRVVGVGALRRRLGGGESARAGVVEQTLMRRRSLRARDRAKALVSSSPMSH
ncbi:MAG: GNAT family N-acetyltransferase [Actinomycetota bacterium]|nr:GNAT family N-acetyltransferase [Actinomycetota bacterium]